MQRWNKERSLSTFSIIEKKGTYTSKEFSKLEGTVDGDSARMTRCSERSREVGDFQHWFFVEWGDVYYKKARPSNGWMGMSEIAANRDFCYVIKRVSQKGANTVDKKMSDSWQWNVFRSD